MAGVLTELHVIIVLRILKDIQASLAVCEIGSGQENGVIFGYLHVMTRLNWFTTYIIQGESIIHD